MKKKIKKSESIFLKAYTFVEKIKNQFFPPPPPKVDPIIQEKVEKIHEDATKILTNLDTVKNKLKNKIDTTTYSHLVKILNPLKEDPKKLQGLLKKANYTEELTSVLDRYQKWSAKAKNWITLAKENPQEKKIVQEIVGHLSEELASAIDRDILSIINYRDQKLTVENHENDALVRLIEPHIGALNALKERKTPPNLDEFTEWKRWVNGRRAVLFENALLVLDEASE